MSQSSPFSRRMLLLVGTVAVGSLVLGIAFAVFGSKISRAPISDANSYSRSAVGHHAFSQLLRRLGIPVVVSKFESAKKAQKDAVLILAEPRPFKADVARAFRLLRGSELAIVVLPKWGSKPAVARKEWIGSAGLLATGDVKWVAEDVLGIDAQIIRPDRLEVTKNALAARPALSVPQLIRSSSLEPIVAAGEGILLGEYVTSAGKRILVLSDPDIIETHGLGKGENAQFAVAMVERMRKGTGVIVFDETIHGFLEKPSVYRALIEFPLVVATLQVLCVVGLLLWASIGRFGAPAAPEPVIEPGKRFLINNTAALLEFGGHTAHTLQRYYHSTVRDVARQLHAPDQDDAAVEAWLERVGRSRGVKASLIDLRGEVAAVSAGRRVQPRAVLLAANRLYHWKQEMLHGPARDPGPR